MIKKTYLLMIVCLIFLTACGLSLGESTSPMETTLPEPSIPAEQTPPSTLPTDPEHTKLYISGVETDEVIRYFNEVCLNAEFFNSGDPTVLQKWNIPIRYIIHGEPTVEDLNTLGCFAQWLNNLEGFPGIRETTDPAEANLRLHFCTYEDLVILLGSQFHGMDGGVSFWYDEHNAINDAIICIRTDLDQTLRNSVILEELYNALGPIQDTALRPDSIIYAEFSQPQQLTDVDELILKLLYSPELQCGMRDWECETIIRKLYG